MSLDRLFAPDAIALIGASADPEKLAGRPLGYLERHGYPGDLYLVNPGRDSIDGRRCYDSIRDVPEPVDLAMVLVPAPVVASVIEECGEAGVPFALVIASGFAEAGAEDREAAVVDAARKSGVRVVGPNAQGVLDLHAGVTASFSSMLRREDLRPGGVLRHPKWRLRRGAVPAHPEPRTRHRQVALDGERGRSRDDRGARLPG